jgi:uncharacterized membrane protein YsdA (DUF1294 family)
VSRHLLVAFVLINVVAFLAMGLDKLAALRNAWRIRESTLIKFAAFGGFIGVFAGSAVFRHKTLKQPFRGQLIAASLLNVLWIYLAWTYL